VGHNARLPILTPNSAVPREVNVETGAREKGAWPPGAPGPVTPVARDSRRASHRASLTRALLTHCASSDELHKHVSQKTVARVSVTCFSRPNRPPGGL
jgi:hypothetical protein